jgi:phosphotransferase system HPr (HPr) family protein
MICKKVEIKDERGLHLRPATLFACIAQKFDADILVQYRGKTVGGKSAIGLLQLEVTKGGEILIYIQGREQESAMKALLEFICTN